MSKRGSLDLRNVSKSYNVDGNELRVLDHINFGVEGGSFVSIVGPSGCGKSTILRLVVGLDDDFSGEIDLDGKLIQGTSLNRGIVFQDHRLLPWLTLEENIGLSLENSKWSREEKTRAVRDHIELVGLKGFEKVFPHQLSGGMAQRAAIARGLTNRPEILLLDEPLGALDALTRVRLQEEILRIWRAEKTTMILVTHDVDEAIYLSDRVLVMNSNPGRIVLDIDIDLPPSRDRGSVEFARTKATILQYLGSDHGKNSHDESESPQPDVPAIASAGGESRVRTVGRALGIAGVMAVAGWLGAAEAVDTPPSDDLPDLSAVRARIYAGEFEKAAEELEELQKTVRHADIFNLLGFSLRSIDRFEEADRWYREALYFDPEHRQALEYQGELFIKTGQLDKAEENLTTLKILCHPDGCPEFDQLKVAIDKAKAS